MTNVKPPPRAAALASSAPQGTTSPSLSSLQRPLDPCDPSCAPSEDVALLYLAGAGAQGVDFAQQEALLIVGQVVRSPAGRQTAWGEHNLRLEGLEGMAALAPYTRFVTAPQDPCVMQQLSVPT